MWTENKVPLNNNKSKSLGRLKSLLKRLEQNSEIFKAYDQVIKDQLVNNVIEKVSKNQSESTKELFLPHGPVIRQNATKLRVVYDASTRSECGYSLSNFLEKGPSLQNKLWDILIRTRFRPAILCAGVEKAILQVRIKEKERESLKFHWIENLTDNTIHILRFIRLVFGLNQSPFILEVTLKTYFKRYESIYVELIRKIRDDMYVDDSVTGGESLQEVEKNKV